MKLRLALIGAIVLTAQLAASGELTVPDLSELSDTNLQKVALDQLDPAKLNSVPETPLTCRPKDQWTDQADDISDTAAQAGLTLAANSGVTRDEDKIIARIRHRADFRDCGFRDVEIKAVLKYTLFAYKKLNSALWTGLDLEKFAVFRRLLSSAMGKIAQYNGFVFRSTNISDEELDKYKKGAILPPYPAYMSTSQTPAMGRRFGRNVFVMAVHSCVNIAPLSAFNKKEKEVLCPVGLQLKILTKIENEEGPIFLMQEVSNPT